MAFIRRKSNHLCMPPVMIVDPDEGIAVVDGSIGDLYRCDECDRLWQCRFTHAFPGRAWWKPSWISRLLFGRAKKPKKIVYESGLSILDRTMSFRAGISPVHPMPAVPRDPWSNDVLVSP